MGAGETAMCPVPAAIANAIHMAAGVRLRDTLSVQSEYSRCLQRRPSTRSGVQRFTESIGYMHSGTACLPVLDLQQSALTGISFAGSLNVGWDWRSKSISLLPMLSF